MTIANDATIAGPRRNVWPHRQLIYWLFDDFVRAIGPVDTMLDLGCGTMSMAKYVDFSRYIGVDSSESQINKGLARVLGAEGHIATIETMPSDLTGDFVVCMQCMGVNKRFDPAATVACVQRIIEATRPGGHVFFNTGNNSRAWDEEVERAVRTAFTQVKVHPYGRFRFAFGSHRLAWALAAWMRKRPEQAGKKRGTVYMCMNKR